MKATVYYSTVASFGIKVDIPDDTPVEDRAEVARQMADDAYEEQAPGGLCHQCAGEWDLGDSPEADESKYGVHIEDGQ